MLGRGPGWIGVWVEGQGGLGCGGCQGIPSTVIKPSDDEGCCDYDQRALAGLDQAISHPATARGPALGLGHGHHVGPTMTGRWCGPHAGMGVCQPARAGGG